MDSFSSLTEFSVAIAGFSGITMAVQARNAVVNELQSFRNTLLIAFALAAAFGSVIPPACVHLGATGSQVWLWASLSLALICAALIVAPFLVRHSMSPDSRRQLSRVIWVVSVGGSIVLLFALLANVAGAFGEPRSSPVYLGNLWFIFLATLMYARMLIGLRASAPE